MPKRGVESGAFRSTTADVPSPDDATFLSTYIVFGAANAAEANATAAKIDR